MKVSKLVLPGALLLLAVLALFNSASADTMKASIKILTPANNAQLDADEQYPLQYEVVAGAGGDHFHVWVDDDRGPGIHDSKGTYMLPKLTPGKHTITIKVVDKGHIPTGPQQSITVSAK